MHRPATLFACRAWVPATRKRSLGLPVEHILLQSRLRLKINPLATSKLGHIYKKPGFSTLTAGFLPALVAGEWSWTKAEKGGFLRRRALRPLARPRRGFPAEGPSSPAEGWANLTTRVFYSKLLLQRSVMYTRCIIRVMIDSNFRVTVTGKLVTVASETLAV